MAHVRAFAFQFPSPGVCTLGAVAAALAISSGTPAAANVTDLYTGQPFTSVDDPTLGNNLTGSFTFDVAPGFTGTLGTQDVVAFSLTAGAFTETQANANIANIFDAFTLTNGVPTAWHYNIGGVSDPSLPSQIFSSSINLGGYSIGDLVNNSTALRGPDVNRSSKAGSWTGVSSPTPEPATWAMMLTGFAGLGYALRRKRGAIAA